MDFLTIVKWFNKAQAPLKPATTTRAPTALIIEDNQVDAELLERVLRDLGWVCELVHNPKEAFNILDGETFDVCFVDVNFPNDMTGFQFEEELRKSEIRKQKHRRPKHMPVVYVTGVLAFRIYLPDGNPSTAQFAQLKSGQGLTAICKPALPNVVAQMLKQCNGLTEHPDPSPRPQWQISLSMGLLSIIFYALGRGWLDKIAELFIK